MDQFTIAATIILILLGFVGVYYARKHWLIARKSSVGAIKKEVAVTGPKHTTYSNPGLIIKEINSSKPYMREEVEQSYSGLGVDWNLKFKHISVDKKKGIARLGLMGDFLDFVFCEVKLNKYAELKTIKEDTRIRVTGTINYVNSGTIYLKDVKLNF